MARDYKVQFEDGSWHLIEEVPDDVHPNDVLAKAESGFKQRVTLMQPQSKGFVDMMKDVGKNVARGAGQTLGFWLDRPGYEDPLLGMAGVPAKMPEGQVQQQVQQALPPPKFESTGERYLRAGTEGLGGAFMGPGATAMPIRSALGGVAGGLGAEAGGDITNNSPVGRVIGAFMGALGMGSLGAARTNAPALARETLEGVSPDDLSRAQTVMQTAKQQGMPMNLSQAMPRPSNIDDMVAELAQSRHGNQTIAGLRKQPEILRGQAPKEVARIPGQVATPQAAANQMQDAATETIQSVKQARTAVTAPLYQLGGDIGARNALAISGQIDDFLKAPGRSPEAVAAANELKARLAGKTNANDIKAQVDWFRGAWKNNLSPAHPKVEGEFKHLSGELMRSLEKKSIPIQAANTIYAELSKNVVDPLKKSIVGRIAGRTGAQPDREAIANTMMGILKRGTPPGGQSEILALEKAVRKTDPEAFPTLVKSYIADEVDKAMKTATNRTSPDFAKALKNSLYGTPQQQQGMRDMLAGVARSKGMKEAEVVRGFENFLILSGHLATRPPRITGMNSADIQDVAGASKFASALEVQYWTQTGRKIRHAFSGNAYRTMDALLNTPEGVQTLQALANKSMMSPQAANAVGAFYGSLGDSDSIEE